jgi:hypothetical protein
MIRHLLSATAVMVLMGALVSQRSNDDWQGGYVRTTLPGARSSDRLWVHGAHWGGGSVERRLRGVPD